MAAYLLTNDNGNSTNALQYSKPVFDIQGKNLVKLDIPSIFDIYGIENDYSIINGEIKYHRFVIMLNKNNEEFYNELGVHSENQKTAVIFPIFTTSAYHEPGFYTYYNGKCDSSCLTVPFADEIRSEGSGNAAQIFKLLGYQILSDIDVDKNPETIHDYDKIILLHNEYVTKREFDAITNHPNVIYLYPNALYAEVSVDYTKNTITLIKGHGYPDNTVANGFGWVLDNTEVENDSDCLRMSFYKVYNGHMLNCYPEKAILLSTDLLRKIKEF